MSVVQLLLPAGSTEVMSHLFAENLLKLTDLLDLQNVYRFCSEHVAPTSGSVFSPLSPTISNSAPVLRIHHNVFNLYSMFLTRCPKGRRWVTADLDPNPPNARDPVMPSTDCGGTPLYLNNLTRDKGNRKKRGWEVVMLDNWDTHDSQQEARSRPVSSKTFRRIICIFRIMFLKVNLPI